MRSFGRLFITMGSKAGALSHARLGRWNVARGLEKWSTLASVMSDLLDR